MGRKKGDGSLPFFIYMIFITKTTSMKLAKDYYLPTPIFWRKVGDALLACSTLITSYSILEDYKAIALTSLVCGVFGKFLSNIFTTEPGQ